MSSPIPEHGVPSRVGRTMILGMAVVAAGLGAFYMNLNRRQEREERLGSNPHYEQRLAHAGSAKHSDDVDTLPASRVENRSVPLTGPTKDHDSKHSTRANYLSSPGYSESGRMQQPTPQRAKDDGSGRAYTKSPDYVDSYEKTPKYRKTKEVGKPIGET